MSFMNIDEAPLGTLIQPKQEGGTTKNVVSKIRKLGYTKKKPVKKEVGSNGK